MLIVSRATYIIDHPPIMPHNFRNFQAFNIGYRQLVRDLLKVLIEVAAGSNFCA
jgi:hypothetical protein